MSEEMLKIYAAHAKAGGLTLGQILARASHA